MGTKKDLTSIEKYSPSAKKWTVLPNQMKVVIWWYVRSISWQLIPLIFWDVSGGRRVGVNMRRDIIATENCFKEIFCFNYCTIGVFLEVVWMDLSYNSTQTCQAHWIRKSWHKLYVIEINSSLVRKNRFNCWTKLIIIFLYAISKRETFFLGAKQPL